MQTFAALDDVTLTKTELGIVKRIASGMTTKEVATELCCSKRTVDFHVNRIYSKLGVSNRVQLMRQAIVLGLVAVPELSQAA